MLQVAEGIVRPADSSRTDYALAEIGFRNFR